VTFATPRWPQGTTSTPAGYPGKRRSSRRARRGGGNITAESLAKNERGDGTRCWSRIGRAPVESSPPSPRRRIPMGYTLLFITNGNASECFAVQVVPLRPGKTTLLRSRPSGFFDLVMVVDSNRRLVRSENYRARQGQSSKLNIGTINIGSTQKPRWPRTFQSMSGSRRRWFLQGNPRVVIALKGNTCSGL